MCARHLWPEPRVLDAWTVVDRWWTSEPLRAEYREVLVGGQKIVERRTAGESWKAVRVG